MITYPKQTNGVTILIGGQVLTTQPPTVEDHKFLYQVCLLSKEFQKEKPRG